MWGIAEKEKPEGFKFSIDGEWINAQMQFLKTA